MTNFLLRVGTARPAPAPVLPLFSRLFDTVLTWRERARSRRVLGQLDDALLRDIGVDRGVIVREIGKPFWRA